MKTVREAAQELNISRQALYSKLTKDFKARFTTIKKINNRDTLVISSDGIKELKRDTVKADNEVDSQVDNEVDSKVDSEIIKLLDKPIELLQQQLKEKDKELQQLKEEHKKEMQQLKEEHKKDIQQIRSDYKEQLQAKDNQLKDLTELNRNNQILLRDKKETLELLEVKEKKSITERIRGIFKNDK